MKSQALQIFVAVACVVVGIFVGYLLRDVGGNREALRAEQDAVKAQRESLGALKRVVKAKREALACSNQLNASRKKASGLKKLLSDSVAVISGYQKDVRYLKARAGATRPPVDAEPDVDQLYGLLQYCCDWPHMPMSEEQERCRHLLFGDNGDSTFRGEVRYWGGTRPDGPPPPPLNIEIEEH
jgi:hypothetical protein